VDEAAHSDRTEKTDASPSRWRGADLNACLPRNFLTPCLLLLADEAPSYGYELHARLKSLGLNGGDHGTVYRLLNLMESDGLVTSSWERSSSGPRRRRYRVTEEGRQTLAEWVHGLQNAERVLVGFLQRWQRDAMSSNGAAPRHHEAPNAAREAQTQLVAKI
jgi:PadR family transcriptional regulator, regulatory protein PadR